MIKSAPRSLTLNILTLFPDLLEVSFSYSILKRAREKGLFNPKIINIRDFSRDKHHTVDDKPYGGGSGMVIKVGPVARALYALRRGEGTGPVLLLAPTGRRFDQKMAQKLSRMERFTLICGHYEGVDQRVSEKLCDQEVSIGDYVLTGGEPAAIVISDAVIRLLPQVLGSEESALQDSFSDGLLDYPHYTRPFRYRGWKVPDILISGAHKKVLIWRREQQLKRTMQHRPDLLEKAGLDHEERKKVAGFARPERKLGHNSRRK
ncbi:tRNA (guanosine(37)-N1)-methyltransferase TrmD [bacterium]|nr:tRNA (guanosine(37)-N1)-methyltransferase TrmD [bacterium]